MRLFISINFDARTKQKIIAVQNRLEQCVSGKFVHPDNIHLTLAFLGEVSPSRTQAVKQAMNQTHSSKLQLTFDHTGCFNRNGDGVWWLGIKHEETLIKLQKTLTCALIVSGFSLDPRPFKPHITLARRVKPHDKIMKDNLLPAPFFAHADTISLMHSHRIDGRLTYTEIYKTTLQK